MIRKKMKKIIVALLVTMSLTTQLAFAHSGRTDSNGGHRDNQNKSGLGPYHYHCGGYPAHLHNNGVCPYKSTSSSGSSSGSSSSSSSTTSSQQQAIIAAKKEATDNGYNAGYRAGYNGQEFNDSNSSTYLSEYKSGYSNGYEKGKSELEVKISSAYNEGYDSGYRCQDKSNNYDVQAIKDSYSNGYQEGRKVYIEENTNNYIQYGEEDAHNFVMRTFESNVPTELKEKYTIAYNNKTTELKNIAYNSGYTRALSGANSDALDFKNNDEISSYNEGYNMGVIDLEEENKTAYEAGYNGMEYSVPEKFSSIEAMLMESFNDGVEAIKLEKQKQAKAVTGTLLLATSGVGGFIVMKKKKSKKEEILDLYKDEDEAS